MKPFHFFIDVTEREFMELLVKHGHGEYLRQLTKLLQMAMQSAAEQVIQKFDKKGRADVLDKEGAQEL